MEGKLNFSDYVTIAVLVGAVVWLILWFQGKKKAGCGCGPAAPVGKTLTQDYSKRPGIRSCA